jgi:hypothetical protein
MPRTEIIPVGQAALNKWFCDGLDETEGSEPHDDPEWMARVVEAAAAFGYPLFLRTDLASGKHGWVGTCQVLTAKKLKKRMFGILYEIELQSLLGLPNVAWVLREMLQPSPGFTYTPFGGMPVGKERRYFVRDGAVECSHPYWPEEAFSSFSADDERRQILADLSEQSDEERELLSGYAEALAAVLPDYWSVDFYCDAAGKWWFIDAAEGEKSWHPDCPFAPAD